jgi:hypothetical protein
VVLVPELVLLLIHHRELQLEVEVVHQQLDQSEQDQQVQQLLML